MSMRERTERAAKERNKPLTRKRLKQWILYDPHTGIFYRNKDSSYGRGKRGMIAGCTNKILGYVHISVCGRDYYGHRLAWFYMTGKWPTVEIDHKNGIRNDNRWENLREATYPQQRKNRKSVGTNSGYKNVYKHRNGRFYSHITTDYKKISLGGFESAKEAHSTYCKAAKQLHKEFARFT